LAKHGYIPISAIFLAGVEFGALLIYRHTHGSFPQSVHIPTGCMLSVDPTQIDGSGVAPDKLFKDVDMVCDEARQAVAENCRNLFNHLCELLQCREFGLP
jgi:hypothetical protein